MNILGVLRSTYLYTALTIAGGAIVIAVAGLITLALRLAGLGSSSPSAEAVREMISTAVAILIFAVPVGAIHLWLVQRSLRDPGERQGAPRHLFLNAWIVVGLFMAFNSISNLAELAIVHGTRDAATEISSLVVAIPVALIGWRWRGPTRSARRDAQLIGAFVTLVLATLAVVMETSTLATALLYSVVPAPRPYFLERVDLSQTDPRLFVWASLIGLAGGFGMWAIGLRWQWSWRDVPFRTIYAAAGFGLGLALITVLGSELLARLIGSVGRGVDPAQLGTGEGLQATASGLVLVAMHLTWLLRDRGRIALPERVTDRIVTGIAALCGLTALALAAVAWGSVIVQDWLRLGPPQDDPLTVRDRAVATLVFAVVLYPFPWRGFLRSTAGDPRSGLRRAYVLLVAVASLLGAIVAGVISVTNVIQMALGATLGGSAIRATIDAAGWLAIFAVVLAAHVWLLVRDMRAARAVAPVAAVRPVAVDPLLAILDDLVAGRIAKGEAASRIRALTTSPGAVGKTA